MLNDLEQRIEEADKKINNGFYTPIAEQIVGFYSDIQKIREFEKENLPKKLVLLENKILNLFEKALSYLGGFYASYQLLKNSFCEYKAQERINSKQAILYLIVEYSLLKELNPEKSGFCNERMLTLRDFLLEKIKRMQINNSSKTHDFLKSIESVLYLLELKLEEQTNNPVYKKAYSSARNFIRNEILEKITD
ncbi:MAG: hypothetical protein QXU20_01545 [Candidatus Woesearchaeota archaeon]